ncbi:expressed unknown protein [Seminavis robusta]|uniref:Uncharacterized protein n=1 Tax=Seminavis robusta TaxID=568900 RepID=A0A9N8HE93_9STRA|nr:expressed unknown protein [Seminavis robusta]|eukprot:Sro294_g110120.1 n/a (252) ;mRNA; r:4410-5165
MELCQQLSWKKRKSADGIDYNDDKDNNQDWETLFYALQRERVTQAEALLQAHTRESEEREKLMRTYNQELESENNTLRGQAAKAGEQLQRQQELETQLQQLQDRLSQQEATIHAYQQLTGATLSNVQLPQQTDDKKNKEKSPTSGDDEEEEASTDKKEDEPSQELDFVCCVKNPETKVATKFRISTVPSTEETMTEEQQSTEPAGTILKYAMLENPKHLPEFLQGEIEFESTQLPPLLQNVLRGIFPEEEE